MPHSIIYSLFSSLLALATVLGLILLSGRLLRNTRFSGKADARLALNDSIALDAKRRLVLVRADQREFLLLTGGGCDLCLGEITGRVP